MDMELSRFCHRILSATILPHRRGVGRRAETNLLGSKAARSGRIPTRRKGETNRFIRSSHWRWSWFAAGGGGRLGGLPRGGGKAGDTWNFIQFGTYLQLEILIFSVDNLIVWSLVSQYSWERGRAGESSRTNTNSELSKVKVCLEQDRCDEEQVQRIRWWRRKSFGGRSGASKNSPGTSNWVP